MHSPGADTRAVETSDMKDGVRPKHHAPNYGAMASDHNEDQDTLLTYNDTDDERRRPETRRHWVVAFKDFLVNNPILICTFCLQFLTYFAKHMVEVPMIKLFEQAICNRYYASQGQAVFGTLSDVDESHCKIPAVQDELAGLVGLKFTFDALPALVTALYYGSVADRFGRRLVLALCCVGTACSLAWILFICYAEGLDLPVKLIWASSLFLCLGGSQRVAKSMNFTIIADATDVSHRYSTEDGQCVRLTS